MTTLLKQFRADSLNLLQLGRALDSQGLLFIEPPSVDSCPVSRARRVKRIAFTACFLCSLTCSMLLSPDPSTEKPRLVQKHKQASPLKPV